MKTLQIIAENMEDIKAASPYDVDSIELVSHIDQGGFTPSLDLITQASLSTTTPIHVMVRHSENIITSDQEYDKIIKDIFDIRQTKAQAIVVGILDKNHKIDVERMRQVVLNAYPLEVTFHRAFDAIEDKFAAIKTLVELGVTRVLTAGGTQSIDNNIETLQKLSKFSENLPIAIMAGGGINSSNVQAILKNCDHLHVNSLVRRDNDARQSISIESLKKYIKACHEK